MTLEGLTAVQIVASVVAAPAGAIGHELTHALVGRVLGARVSTSLLRLYVDFKFDEAMPTWKHRLVLLSPLLVGFGAGVTYALGQFSLGGWWLAAVIGWLFYTVSLEAEDYSIRLSRCQKLTDVERKNKAAIEGFLVVLIGVVMLYLSGRVATDWQMLLWLGGFSSMLGGTAGLFLKLHHLGGFDNGTRTGV